MPIVRANSKTLAIMPVTDQMGRQFPCQSRQLPEKTPVLKPSDAKHGTHYLSASRLNYGKEESPALLLLCTKGKDEWTVAAWAVEVHSPATKQTQITGTMPPDGPCCSVKERPRQRRLLQQQRLVLVQEGHRHGIIKYRQDDHSAMNASGVMPSTRPAAQTFRDLLVWQKAHQFVLGVYQLTATFPRQETFGLALQMRRAAV